MSAQVPITGLVMGLISSLHCIGMCGPIALAVPMSRSSSRTLGMVFYNAGRVITYTTLGAVAGIAGTGFYRGGWSQLFSVVCGILIVLAVLGATLLPRLGMVIWFGEKVQRLMHRFLKIKGGLGVFLLGVANGLLPCGMVYLAVTMALSTSQSVFQGVLFMLFFGFGTIPALFIFSAFSTFLGVNFRNKIKKILPVITLTMGILLILRGLNIGIPFISPFLPASPTETVICHP